MGYREMGSCGKYAKPIGDSMFYIFELDSNIVWKNVFKNNDEILIWESHSVSIEEFNISKLKEWEKFSSIDHGDDSSFEFGVPICDL